MSNLTHIYENKNGKILLLDILNYTLEEFKANPQGCYPSWDINTMIASEIKYEYPCINPSGELREKTRVERILEGEIELLQDGEYVTDGKITTVPCPEGLFKKIWDKEAHIWKEGATEEEIKDFYYSLINKFKAEILDTGFNFNGHQQKCREKDLALLGNAVAALDDMATFSQSEEEKTVNWAFNDNDILLMTETDLRKMRIAGTIFINTTYGVEAELKASEPNILLEKKDFINKINELSEVKCYEEAL